MSLLDDVSIVVTPNGYKAGELYAVVPVPSEGAELVTNGDFATDSDWTKGTGWAISGGKANCDGSQSAQSNFYQVGIVPINIYYQVTFTATVVSGGVTLAIGGSNAQPITTASGTYTVYSKATSGDSNLYFSANSTFVGSIDNVSVKEYTSADMDVTRATAATRVDENGLVNYAEVLGDEELTDGGFPTGTSAWYEGTGWSLGNGYAESDGTNAPLDQYNALEIGKQYIVVITVTGMTASPLSVRLGTSSSDQVLQITSDGTYTAYGTAGSTTFRLRSQGFNGKVTNVSVKEVTRDNVPRIDYTGGGCPHILAEPQRTNLVTDSESYTGYFNNSGTLIYNNTTSPDGLENGAKNYASTTGSFKGLSKNYGSTLNNTAYTLSIFAKAGEFDYLYFYNVGAPSGNGGVWFNLSTGNVGTTNASWSSAKMESFGNGWYRCSAVITPSGTSDNLYILLADANNSVTATANGTDGYYIYGAQLEEGSYATSYIPTSGSTVTRNQDIFTRDGIGSLINSTEGVLFIEASTFENGADCRITLSDGTITNRVSVEWDILANTIKGFVGSDGNLVSPATYNQTNSNKIALKYKENDCALWINGTEVDTDFSVSALSGTNQLEFSNYGGLLPFEGKVKHLQVYTTALTDEQLTSLTT